MTKNISRTQRVVLGFVAAAFSVGVVGTSTGAVLQSAAAPHSATVHVLANRWGD